jgi:hypothetical protein
MYSLGIFGSCREKMFFRAISAVELESFPSFVYVWKVTASSPVPTVPKDDVPETPCGTKLLDAEDDDEAEADAEDEDEDDEEEDENEDEEDEEVNAASICAKRREQKTFISQEGTMLREYHERSLFFIEILGCMQKSRTKIICDPTCTTIISSSIFGSIVSIITIAIIVILGWIFEGAAFFFVVREFRNSFLKYCLDMVLLGAVSFLPSQRST